MAEIESGHVGNRINKSKTITMRFPAKLVERITKDIEDTGDFRTLTEWMQMAAREYLKKREDERYNH